MYEVRDAAGPLTSGLLHANVLLLKVELIETFAADVQV